MNLVGPDVIRFKHIKEIRDDSVILNVEGTIGNVGLDFVDFLESDDRVITTLTDKISHVKWLDKSVGKLLF